MEVLSELVALIAENMPRMFLDTGYLIIIAIVLFLVHSQYKRVQSMESQMFGLRRRFPWKDTIGALGYGLLGGVLATALFLLLGISLSGTGIIYLWFVAVALVLIHPRFMCFAYAGGIVGLSHLLFGFPDIHVAAVMALVAILHMVEALLIRVHGYQDATPLYVKHRDGRVVGGFSMQKFWPLPFIALVAAVIADGAVDFGTVQMPDWWPLLEPGLDVPGGHAMVYMMFPVIAALGYGDMAVTSTPRSKAKGSSLQLFWFSSVLLMLAVAAAFAPLLSWVAALFSPLGHEWVIHQGQKREQAAPPIFTNEHGFMVLDVYPGSPADTMGLRPGDVIRSINGFPVHEPADLVEQMHPWVIDPVFEVENMIEQREVRTVSYKGKLPPIGIIPVPNPMQSSYVKLGERTLLSRLHDVIRGGKGRTDA